MNSYERISLNRCIQSFADFNKYLIVPETLDTSEYLSMDKTLNIVRFDDKYFTSEIGYNLLCKSKYFYKPFLEYDYMLLYQLDSFVFENTLFEWSNKGYDYIGAPWMNFDWFPLKKMGLPNSWIDKILFDVGNGGFSLRKIDTFYTIAKSLHFITQRVKFHEDIWWTNVVNRIFPSFKIPKQQEALQFAFETDPEECYKLNLQKLPFGCHAWEKYGIDFWRSIFKQYGYEI